MRLGEKSGERGLFVASAASAPCIFSWRKMETLKIGMRHVLEWEVTEKLCTSRGGYKVFSTPSMNRRGQVHRAAEEENRTAAIERETRTIIEPPGRQENQELILNRQERQGIRSTKGLTFAMTGQRSGRSCG